MKTTTQYGYPISSILSQICIIIFFILIIFFFILVKSYILSVFLTLLIILYCYFAIFKFKSRFSYLREKILAEMIKNADLNGSEQILDLGTGAGYVAIGFSKSLQKGRVIGVDKYDKKTPVIGSNFIEELKINFFYNKLGQAKQNAILEKQKDSIAFIKSDLKKHFPFANTSFDLVLSSQFLYCIPHKNLERVLKEIDRVLKPSGKLIFFESEKFIYWDISQVKSFFEKLGYNIHINQLNIMANKCIFIAEKSRK